jgi:crotonobetainyl-CoA:carnitine CoA-transferase CaiB-like acyl-CoA transferase
VAGRLSGFGETGEYGGPRGYDAAVQKLDGYREPGIDITVDRTPGAVRLPPAKIGARSRKVLERLGVAGDGIESLLAENIIG